jgi:hypothetical protein
MADKNSKNQHILSLFLSYQQYISQQGPLNPEFQVLMMEALEKEINDIYG